MMGTQLRKWCRPRLGDEEKQKKINDSQHGWLTKLQLGSGRGQRMCNVSLSLSLFPIQPSVVVYKEEASGLIIDFLGYTSVVLFVQCNSVC